jgi:triosephosphate isomerase
MKYLIVANWKMNPASQEEAESLVEGIKKAAKEVEAVICPPFVYLPLLKGVILGAQDVFFEEKGAFTGEVSPGMLKDLGVEYVLVGHSERRKYFNETDQTVNKKLKAILETGLKAIVCVGETKEELEGGQKNEVIERQLTEGLNGITRDQIKQITFAYEPVWAIGTGKNCSTDDTMQSSLLIRKVLANAYNRELADDAKILYGGSVNSKNAASYLKDAQVNGLLVGGASLNPEEFNLIIEECQKI